MIQMIQLKGAGGHGKRFMVLAAVLLLNVAARPQSVELIQRLKQHEYILASDSLRGRETGTPDAAKAAAYIRGQLREMGVRPYSDSGYDFPFTYKEDKKGNNVMALIPGSDPKLKGEYLIIGAHYDHIGVSKHSVKEDSIFNGADDNASGTSALLEITRMLHALPEPPKRSILVAFFDAEEVGLEGSTYLAEHCVVPIEKVRLMMSIDMVGYLRASGYLQYIGHGSIKGGKRLIASVPWESPYGKMDLKEFENSYFTATDTRPFAKKGCPTLAVTTGLKSPYHRVEDNPDGIDYEGLSYITNHLFSLIVKAASDEHLAPSGRVASVHRMSPYEASKSGFRVIAQCGSSHLRIPDYEITGQKKISYGMMAEWQLRPLEKLTIGIGAGYRSIGSGYWLQESYRMHTAEAMLRIQRNSFTLKFSGLMNIRLGGYIAPYYRYAFAGSLKDSQNPETVAWDRMLQRHQYGVSLGINMCINHLLLEYGYQFDLNPMFLSDAPFKGQGRGFHLGVGYQL